MASIMLVLKCLTNLHAGSGEENYNIIDNEVERDPVTNYPTINASGVKGALRAFLEGNGNVEQWFGSDSGGNRQAGFLKILNASMLALPMRTTAGGDQPYQLVYTDEMREQYEELTSAFGVPKQLGEEKDSEAVWVEGCRLKKMSEFQVGKNGGHYSLYRMDENDFKTCSLPVIARNKLDNGISKHLWYEEVVPHKSIFYIPVIANDKDKELLMKFKNAVDGKVIQFGGNASIGYGLCKVFVEEGNHGQEEG